MKLQLLASAALALLAAVPGAVSEEPHAAVAKPIESFTNVLQAVSPKKDDSYDEDSYDMDSYDEDSSEDEELEAVGVAKKSNSRKRSRERRRRRRRRRSRGRRRRRRRSRDRRRRRRSSRRRSCRSSFCFDRPWSWECRHCRFEGEDMELMESGPISSGDYSSSSDYPDYSSDLSDLSKDSSDLSESESEDSLDLDSYDLLIDEDEGDRWRRSRRFYRGRGRRYSRRRFYRGRGRGRRFYRRRFYRGRGRSFCRRNPWRCSDSASDSAESYDSYDEEY